MAFLAILHLLLGLTILYAKNVPPENLYDVLVKKCPTLNVTDTSFKNQDIFKNCKSWKDISETKTLTEDTKRNVLCLLYYDTFISLCTEINTRKVTNVTIHLVPDLKDYKIDNVCKNLTLFPPDKKFEHNVNTIISDEYICYKICLNFDGTLVHECSLAHYFANYKISTPTLTLTRHIVPSNQQSESNQTAVKSSDSVLQQSQKNLLPESPNVNQTPNKESIVQQDSAGKEPNTVQNINSAITSSNTTENKIVKVRVSPDVTNKQLVANSNVEVADENPVNLNPSKDESQTKDKSPAKEEKKDDSQKPSESVPAEGISEQNAQETVPETGQQKNDNTNKGETDIEAEQPNSIDQPGPMIDDDQNMEEEEGNDGNYKEEEEKQVNGNGEGEKKKEKPSTLTLAGEMPANYNTAEDLDGESYFFSYFMVICVLFVLGYVGYHNRQKVMALMLEGKRGKRQGRGRRPNSANYHKLDSNLEEAISSTCTKNSSHVIY